MPLLVALQFLTVLPISLRRAPTGSETGAAVGWYPAVGYVLGGVLALLDMGLRSTALPLFATAFPLLAILAILTGFLHLDGLLDVCDAAFAPRTPAQRLEIARDPRAGAFGVVGVVLLLGTKAAAVAALTGASRPWVLLCVPALARCVMAAAVVLLPAARGTAGLGGGVKAQVRPPALVLAAVFGIVPAAVVLRAGSVPLIAGAIIGGGAIALFAVRRLGGATGDVYGAVCECAETAAFLAAVAAMS